MLAGMAISYRRSPLLGLARRSPGVPEWLARRIAGEPVEVEGRVLNRGVQVLLALAERTGTEGLEGATVEERRANIRRVSRLGMPVATNLRVYERVIDGPASRLRLRVYRPFGAGRASPAIVYFHGGGWVVGGLDTHDAPCRVLAAASRCVVVSVDYRLAPEHPFPAPVDDCLSAWQWVTAHADELGIDASAVGVMGDSAGANLATVVARVGRDLDGPPPAAQGLVYPATDFSVEARSVELFAEGFFLTRESMHWFRDHYLPSRADRTDPLASPLLADDVAGVAPALVWTAGFDPLRDEGMAYAEKLEKAGVPTRHHCYDDQVHGFFGMGVVPGGLGIIEEVCTQMGDLLRESAGAA